MRTRRLLLIFILFVFTPFASLEAQRDSIRYSIYFHTASATISQQHKIEVQQLIDSLRDRLLEVIVTGNADNTGSNHFNKTLSNLRVDATLKLPGLSEILGDIKLHPISNGEAFPLYDNTTAEGRQMNRRTDIIFLFEKKAIAEVKPSVPEPFRCGNLDKMYNELSFPYQQFCIDVTKDTFLVGERGTIIHYKANTIKRTHLSCHCFTLRLNEYFDKSDLILNNLTTTSDGRVLESGGMIKLDGYCDGNRYDLKAGEFFTVMVPADTILPGMKLLSANRENDSGYLNWQMDKYDPDLGDFDYYRMLMKCRGSGPSATYRCRFFFCRIGNLFRNKKYQNNKDLMVNAAADKEKELLSEYELKGEDLAVALEKSKENTGKDALKYYVYKNYNWDYRNIDRYKPGMRFVNYIVKNKPDQETDVKIVFKSSKTAVPCFEKSQSYTFREVTGNAAIWVIGLRYTIDNEIYLALEEANTSDKRTTLDFKRVSVDELKTMLKKIN